MNLLLVTSQVTYLPHNYGDLLFPLIEKYAPTQKQKIQLQGLVELKNCDYHLIATMFKLPFVGVFRLSKELIKNTFQLVLKKRSRFCRQKGVAFLSWKDINSTEAVQWVKEHQIDLIINLRTRSLYKKEILNAPTIGCLNIHHGLLPQYRGTFCDLYALAEKRAAGFTIHVMDEKIDNGPIINQKIVSKPGEFHHYQNYLSQTMKHELQALIETLEEIAERGQFPQGSPNQSENKIYTRNPDRKMINTLKNQGLIL